VRAEDESDTQAIGGTRLRAIGGTRLRAIGGTRLRAEDESDLQAIGGTRLRAIGGTRLRATGGTRLRAENESDTQAIGGTRLRAIGGTRLRNDNTLPDDNAVSASVIGPVSAVDWSTGNITVLDETVHVSNADSDQRFPQVGELAAIVDCDGDNSQSALVAYGKFFVPGVDEVTITGEVQGSDESTATIMVNGYTVDYSQLLVDAPEGISIPVGATVTVKGTLY